MRLPGYTAAAALYHTSHCYQSGASQPPTLREPGVTLQILLGGRRLEPVPNPWLIEPIPNLRRIGCYNQCVRWCIPGDAACAHCCRCVCNGGDPDQCCS
jgi:hypothetical protein